MFDRTSSDDTLILGDFTVRHGIQDRPILEEEINGTDYGMLNWDTTTRIPPNAEPSSSYNNKDIYLKSHIQCI